MTSRIVKTALAAALALSVAAPATPALASHYMLVDVDIVDAATRDKLDKDGVATTDALLDKIAKKSDRAAFSRRVGIDRALLDSVVRQVDMLRVRGIGPKMMRLLDAAGVRTIAELRKQAPEDLFVRVVKVNDERHLSEIVPEAGVLAGWIEQAKDLPIIVED
jgi:predicted flap endonuclease-1-like 5' DNA nuclease